MEKNKQEWIKMKFWTVSAVLGMCLTCFTVLYFFYFSKAYEESRLLNIVNYVKVQCSVYTRYNEVSECKCLIRAIDSARQVSVVIDAKTQDGKEFNDQLLEECTDQLWLTGAIVLDANGNTVGEYSESGDRSRFAKMQEFPTQHSKTLKTKKALPSQAHKKSPPPFTQIFYRLSKKNKSADFPADYLIE